MTAATADRTKYLGGSDAASVLGISPWRSRYRAWCEKTGAETPPSLDSIDYIYFGTLLEPIVASEFQRRLGLQVRQKRALSVHKKYPFIAGHIDRRILKHRAILECKTSNAFDYSKWGPQSDDEGSALIPPHYLAQVDHYMMIEECDFAYLATLIGGNDFRYYCVARNEQREKRLLEAELEFWELVQSDQPPEIESEEDARRRWRESIASKSAVVGLQERTELLELEALQSKSREMDKRIKELRDKLIPMFGDAEYMVQDGEILASLSNSSQTRFDTEAARSAGKQRAEVAAVLSEFSRKIPVRRLKVRI